MDENKNTNSIAIDQKPNQELLKEPKISNGEGASNDAELQKPIQKETT